MPCGEGIPERAAPIYLEQHNLESLAIYAARDGRPWLLYGPPLGGKRRRRGRPERAATTRSIFPSLSPASSYTWPFIRPRWRYRPRSTPRASTRSVPARGAVLYTGQSRPCIEHKGPPSTKNMHTKDGHDSRGRNYKLRRSSPRSRGPPSQSET